MNAQQIQNILEQDEYCYYGLRAMMNNPVTGEEINVQVGNVAEYSYEWEDGDTTNEELNGTSALEITKETILDRMKEIDAYTWNCSQIALLGSEYVQGGNDINEIIMQQAVVLAVWDI